MARRKPAVQPATEPTPAQVVEQAFPVEVEAPVKAMAKATTQAQVIDSNGNVIRTYTLEVHGENFLEYSESYARKIGGTVR